MNHSIINLIRTVTLCLAFLGLSSCSVFEPVKKTASSLYEDMITYFNVYYNAQRLFREGQEEVNQVDRTFRTNYKGDDILVFFSAQKAPPSAISKFNGVIDKGSQILTFRSTSSFADNALLMIGKSYFLTADFLRAERKFGELLTSYPNSDLALEAQLWTLRTYERLKRMDEAVRLSEVLISTAKSDGENVYVAESYIILGRMSMERPEEALAYFKRAVQEGEHAPSSATASLLSGLVRYKQEEYELAIVEFGSVTRFAPSVDEEYFSSLYMSRSYRHLRRFDQADRILTGMADDFRFVNWRGNIRFERALTLSSLGRTTEALDEFIALDTLFIRQDIGYNAAFEAAVLFENSYRDFANARQYYTRALQINDIQKNRLARRKAEAIATLETRITSYAQLDSTLFSLVEQRERIVSDSAEILLEAEQLWKESFIAEFPDSSRDTLDSTETPPTLKKEIDPISVMRDSIRTVLESIDRRVVDFKKQLSSVSYDLANIYYSDLSEPDSAFYFYQRVLEFTNDSILIPRVYFIQAQLIEQYPDRKFGDFRLMMERIIQRFPDSEYANVARKSLDLPVANPIADPAILLFEKAEALEKNGKPNEALAFHRKIVEEFPRSSMVPKSRLSIAYLYDGPLALPDSAILAFTRVREYHPGTQYSVLAEKRIPPPPTDTTTNTPQTLQEPPGDSEEVLNPAQTQQPLVVPTPQDTTKRPTLRDAISRRRPASNTGSGEDQKR